MIAMLYTQKAKEDNRFMRENPLKIDAFPTPTFNARSHLPPSTLIPNSIDCNGDSGSENTKSSRKRKQKITFPQMVYKILEDSAVIGTESIVAWEDDGTSFRIVDQNAFNDTILPNYSKKKTKFRSFQRQLNIYGFKMSKRTGVYRHQLFRRGHVSSIARIKPRAKKKIDVSEDNNDENKSISRSNSPLHVPSTVISESSDYEVPNSRKIMSNPRLRRVSLEGAASTGKHQGNSENDRNDDLDKCDSDVSFVEATVDFVPFDDDVHAPFPDKETSICARVHEDVDFDLFDDMDDIKLCSCNGCGCCFAKYLQFDNTQVKPTASPN
jgi:hypothetical protein